jgi:hypothetical protein
MYNLGICYDNGYGVTQDFREAARWYRLAAESGAQPSLPDPGSGVLAVPGAISEDEQTLLVWPLESTDGETPEEQTTIPDRPERVKPNWDANLSEMYDLGEQYYKGDGVPQDEIEAVRWWLMAAEEGDPRALYALGVAYLNGRGVAKDVKEAARWYMMSAEAGYPKAQNTLGVCYKNGTGVDKDVDEAVKWYRLAAQQDYAMAQSNLGVCYANGEGVERDYEEASFWFTLAEVNGNDTAQSYREKIEKKLSEEQKARVQTRVQIWLDTKF